MEWFLSTPWMLCTAIAAACAVMAAVAYSAVVPNLRIRAPAFIAQLERQMQAGSPRREAAAAARRLYPGARQ